MTRTTSEHDDNERLDELGRTLIKASAIPDAELEAATSPYLSRRVWARIAAERERRSRSATWFDLLVIGRRTVPAMLAVAVALAGWFWVGSSLFPRSGANARDPHLERVLLTSTAMLSDDDILTFLIDWPAAAPSGHEDQR